jgi:N4-gp56 family major capsid protein
MAATGVTETVATSIDVVAAILQQELIEKAVLLGTVTDYSAWVLPGANTVKLPRSGSFTATNKAENTATTTSSLTFATDDIELNIHGHIVAEIEDIAQEQSALDIEATYMERMATAMALYVDNQVAAALVKASNDIQLSGTSNLVLTLADIAEARKLLNEADVPQEERFLAIPAAQEEAMLNISNFINADQYGSRDGLMNGEIGRVFGFRVIVTNQFSSDSEFVAYHRSHVGFARQMAPKFERQRSSLTKLSDEVSLSLLFGVKQLDSGNRAVYADETVTP